MEAFVGGEPLHLANVFRRKTALENSERKIREIASENLRATNLRRIFR